MFSVFFLFFTLNQAPKIIVGRGPLTYHFKVSVEKTSVQRKTLLNIRILRFLVLFRVTKESDQAFNMGRGIFPRASFFLLFLLDS